MLYDRIGIKYGDYRKPDARIAEAIHREIGPWPKIVNVGAGTGSYEPKGRDVVAVEPSSMMISQRSKDHTPVIQASAESLPFKDGAFDVALAILTIHHWAGLEQGLRELLRVANQRVVLLTWIGFIQDFWLVDYLPQINEIDEPFFPSLDRLQEILGPLRIIPVPIPHDCTDGFLCAYWRRPHAYLDEKVRRAISTFSRIAKFEPGLKRLEKELQSGLWHKKHQDTLDKESMDYGYRIVIHDRGTS
ncbi:MAG: class I SAM-dependent methyltransferase [Deltaproteobacteria bacterium]|nr:class I SAM-dependent methyltransferase [Deltaproteobacteria bacterium]